MTKEIKKITIIGSGIQGSMIAFRNAIYGKVVSVYDINIKAIDATKLKIQGWLEEFMNKGLIKYEDRNQILNRITFTEDYSAALNDSDLIIENVPEKLELKRKVWEELDKLAPEKTLLATNSSSLKSSSINQNVKRKNKTFNVNFGRPLIEDLVEVMWNEFTDQETKEAAIAYLNSINCISIITKKEIKGFSMNRLWRAMKKESLFLWSNDYIEYEDLDRAFMIEWGTDIGPFGLMDIVGLDTIWDIEMGYYYDSGNESDKPPTLLKNMVDKGKLGEKSGEGFYKYPNPSYRDTGWLRKR